MRAVLLVVVVGMVAGCGGGSEPEPPPADYDVKSVCAIMLNGVAGTTWPKWHVVLAEQHPGAVTADRVTVWIQNAHGAPESVHAYDKPTAQGADVVIEIQQTQNHGDDIDISVTTGDIVHISRHAPAVCP